MRVYDETFCELNFCNLRPICETAKIVCLENLALYDIWRVPLVLILIPKLSHIPKLNLIPTLHLCMLLL